MTEEKYSFIPDSAYDDSNVWLELLGNGCNLNPWKRFNSSSRETMRSASHLGQMPVLTHGTPRRITTGLEAEYGKYTSAITMPCNANVIKSIPKYPVTAGYGGIKYCPSELLIYDNRDRGNIDAIELASVSSEHVTFGYRYQYRDFSKAVGAPIPKGKILASSANLRENGEYNFGLEANVVFMSHPACIEDGIVITEDFAAKLGTDNIVDRVLTYDRFTVPLNLYGSEDEYKAIPDVGTSVGKDGVLFATRKVCPVFGFLSLTKKALAKRRTTDKVCYVPANAIVNDINAHAGRTRPNQRLPKDITRQSDYYVEALSDYYGRIREAYKKLTRERGANAVFGPNLHNTIVKTLSDDTSIVPYKVTRTHRRNKLKDYRIEIRLVSRLLARIGHKITDLHGGKAVAVSIIPTADAPVDKFGTVADIIIDGTTCNDRINPGRLYEQYINANGDQLLRHLATVPDDLEKYNQLLEWYRTVSLPMYYSVVESCPNDHEKRAHARYVMKHKTCVWMPPNTVDMGPEQIRRLEAKYPLDYGPVTYRDLAGKTVTTVDPMYIGSIYQILLEKIGDDWAAVAVAKLQTFGLPAKISGVDKHNSQVRNQPVRVLGETETRLLLSTMGGKVTRDLLLLASSPARQRAAVEQIYDSQDPANIESVSINGDDHINRALVYENMLMECYGAELVGGV